MVSLTNFKQVRDHDELAGAYDNPAFNEAGHQQRNHHHEDNNTSQSHQESLITHRVTVAPPTHQTNQEHQIRILVGSVTSDSNNTSEQALGSSIQVSPATSTNQAHSTSQVAQATSASNHQQQQKAITKNQQKTKNKRKTHQQVSCRTPTESGNTSGTETGSHDSGVIEQQQSAISFCSSSNADNDDHHQQDVSSSSATSLSGSTVSSRRPSGRRHSSLGSALDGITNDDTGSVADNDQYQQQQSQHVVTRNNHNTKSPRTCRNEFMSSINDDAHQPQQEIEPDKSSRIVEIEAGTNILKLDPSLSPNQPTNQPAGGAIRIVTMNNEQKQNKKKTKQHSNHPTNQQQQASMEEMLMDPRHFEIRWNDLNYHVEPKWYQRKWSTPFSGGRHSTNSNDPDTSTGSLSGNYKSAPANNRRIRILNNLNGTVRSGQVTAILGPSGAGKTSLLGCLTGKNRTGVSGTIQVKGGPEHPLSICTIPQKDYLLNQLTVRENLWFASRLKHPKDHFDHDSNINRVLDLLKLQSCVNTRISKISGGQYKRVSIAQELLSNPDILILDEPTSGLDSLTCYKTVMVLRDLAKLSPNPMAIIVTIHQPQREVFDLFNHVYILAVGGQAIYEGHPSRSIDTINTCSGSQLHFDASAYNPASYLVEIASGEFGLKSIEFLVEHQLRQFRRRTQQQDYQQALLMQQTMGTTGGSSWTLGTPGGQRKRESPIVARLKSTFGLGSHNFQYPNHQSQQNLFLSANQNQQPLDQALYVGTPVIREPMCLEETNNIPIGHLQAQYRYQYPPQQLQDQPMAHTQEEQTTFGGSNLELTSHTDDKYNYNTNNNSITTMSNQYGGDSVNGEFYMDNRLQAHKHNHDGHFFRHCKLLTKRSWLCLRKDPMLTTLRFAAHIFVPLLITLVYGNRVGKPNACPLYESDIDLMDYAKRGATRLLGLQDELRCTFENVGLYFLSVYAFTFSTMCLTSLSFPLNMHVLLKEVRNGWYSIPTFFIGKTLADFPLEFILPAVTLMLTYPLTGQPSSYMEWRFLVGTFIFVLTSLIAQTQGLIFGALFMNAMQAAVFVAPVSTTPMILLSGFLIRINQMPHYLQLLSTLSYFRYAIEGLTISRYGFNMCPCDPEVITGEPVTARGVPEQLRTMTNYWLSTFNNNNNDLDDQLDSLNNSTTVASVAGAEAETDFFQDLTVLLARANSFGANITSCDDFKPYPMIDFHLEDDQLYVWMGALVGTLIIMKVINYLVVKYSVKFRL